MVFSKLSLVISTLASIVTLWLGVASLVKKGKRSNRLSAIYLTLLLISIFGVYCSFFNNETASSHFQKAKTLFIENNTPLAITEVQETLQSEPSHLEAHKLLGACYIKNNNFEGALTEYKTAVSIDPNDTEAHLGMAGLFEIVGEKNEAARMYKQIIKHPQSTPLEVEKSTIRLKVLQQ